MEHQEVDEIVSIEDPRTYIRNRLKDYNPMFDEFVKNIRVCESEDMSFKFKGRDLFVYVSDKNNKKSTR